MRKSSDGRPAMVFDHVRAAEKGMYANRSVYAVEGLPGVFRRLSGPAAAEIAEKGGEVVRAVFDGGIIKLAPWRAFGDELSEAGMVTPKIGDAIVIVNALMLKVIHEAVQTMSAGPIRPAPDPAPDLTAASPSSGGQTSSAGPTSSDGHTSSHPAEGGRSEPAPDGAVKGHKRSRVASAP